MYLDSGFDPVDLNRCGMYNKYLIKKEFYMPKNQVQFHKGQSLRDFLKLYGTELQCAQAVFQGALAAGLPLPRLRLAQGLPAAHPQGLPGHPLPAAGLADRRPRVLAHQAAADHLVPGDLLAHAIQEWPLGDGPAAPVGRELQHGLDAPAQTAAGDARAG